MSMDEEDTRAEIVSKLELAAMNPVWSEDWQNGLLHAALIAGGGIP